MKISLADAEAMVASARAKLAGLEAQQRSLKSQAQLVPQVEAEFAQLNRDYDVQRTTYQSLLARRESAAMGKDVQDTSGAQFRVIDPPRVSPQPVAPNRIALLGIAFALSLVVGFAASLVASQLMPIFHDARTLRQVSKRPIVGMVSMLPSEDLIRAQRRKSWLFAGGLGWLPSSGYKPLSAGFWPFVTYMILPVVTLTLTLIAHVLRMTRSSMLEVLHSQYIRTARAKGLPERAVILRHALPNGLLPTITVLAFDFGWLIGGIVVIESVEIERREG